MASQAILDEPLRLRNAIRNPPLGALLWLQVIATKMFNGKGYSNALHRVKAERFPNLYMEPMQMNNSENKSYDTIPYLLI